MGGGGGRCEEEEEEEEEEERWIPAKVSPRTPRSPLPTHLSAGPRCAPRGPGGRPVPISGPNPGCLSRRRSVVSLSLSPSSPPPPPPLPPSRPSLPARPSHVSRLGFITASASARSRPGVELGGVSPARTHPWPPPPLIPAERPGTARAPNGAR